MSGYDIFIHSYYITIIITLYFTLFCTVLIKSENSTNIKLSDACIFLIFLIPVANYFFLLVLLCLGIAEIKNYLYKKLLEDIRKSLPKEEIS